jgi:hypothetical protein
MNETQFKGEQDRRSGKDRRSRPTSPFTIQSIRGSRSHYRRKEDTRELFFVDLYSPLSVAVLIFTVCLSVVDAFLTLTLVGHNAEELNPVMDFFLKLGPFHFIMVKWFLTAFGLITLLILKNYYLWHGRVRAAVLLFICPFLYLMLVGYEVLIAVKG